MDLKQFLSQSGRKISVLEFGPVQQTVKEHWEKKWSEEDLRKLRKELEKIFEQLVTQIHPQQRFSLIAAFTVSFETT